MYIEKALLLPAGTPGAIKWTSRQDGRDFAVRLIREMKKRVDSCLINTSVDAPEDRRDQTNILLLVFDKLLHLQDREAMVGFTEVLTDFVASCADGTVPDPSLYRKVLD